MEIGNTAKTLENGFTETCNLENNQFFLRKKAKVANLLPYPLKNEIDNYMSGYVSFLLLWKSQKESLKMKMIYYMNTFINEEARIRLNKTNDKSLSFTCRMYL